MSDVSGHIQIHQGKSQALPGVDSAKAGSMWNSPAAWQLRGWGPWRRCGQTENPRTRGCLPGQDANLIYLSSDLWCNALSCQSTSRSLKILQDISAPSSRRWSSPSNHRRIGTCHDIYNFRPNFHITSLCWVMPDAVDLAACWLEALVRVLRGNSRGAAVLGGRQMANIHDLQKKHVACSTHRGVVIEPL